MTREEFSNGFDTLVSSYRRFRNFDEREPLDTIEFDEYEKSFYLTKAQGELVLGLYTGRNSYGESFESTEEMRRMLSSIVDEAIILPDERYYEKPYGVTEDSKFFTLPPELWFITYESVLVDYGTKGNCTGKGSLSVYPVTQDEYHKVKKNPFRGANDRRALRLDLGDNVVEIVCKWPVESYYVRYLKKLNPIILEDLPNDLTIENDNTARDCELASGLHQMLLELAVQRAMSSKVGAGREERRRDNN